MRLFYTVYVSICVMHVELLGFTLKARVGENFGALPEGGIAAFDTVTSRNIRVNQTKEYDTRTDAASRRGRNDDSSQTLRSRPEGTTLVSPSKNARRFWNHFMLRRTSSFQSVLSIRNNEVHQSKCRALSFTQSVPQEGCETAFLKNNVCFGTCIPSETDSVSCNICSPVKFSRQTLQLKCADQSEVTRVVTVVEECQCEVRTDLRPQYPRGPVLIDPSIGDRA